MLRWENTALFYVAVYTGHADRMENPGNALIFVKKEKMQNEL